MSDIGVLTGYLEGSPYALPDDKIGLELLREVLPRAAELEDRCQAVRAALAGELTSKLHRSSRTSEIYESNAIEGKQATLAETFQIMTDRSLFSVDAAIARYTLHRALGQEPKVQDVVGLAAARILVDQYTRDRARAIAESDLRDMHSLIMGEHPSAGRYKQYLNEIEGAAHKPLPPSDVPAAMAALVRWLRDSDAPLLWRSAVAHAWLTHIHPFDDGNGRMARLLANYTLSFGAYPPLIVKSTSDRGRYISALAHSDEAGDVVPLVRLFVRVLNRQLELMEKPDFAWSLFQKDLHIRGETLFNRWQSTLRFFLQEVAGHLALSRKTLEVVGAIAPSDFELLRARDAAGNGWLAKVRSPSVPRDLLVWVGFSSGRLYKDLESDQNFPALFLSEQTQNPKASRPYSPSVRGLPPRHDELVVVVDEERALFRRGDNVSSLKLAQAAELWAGLLSNYLDSIVAEEPR